MTNRKASWLSHLSGPVKVGLVFALVAMLLAVVGVVRGNVPSNPLSIFLALLISGGSWGIVSWAVATAVVDVEHDVAEEIANPATPVKTDDERPTTNDQ